MTRPLLAWALWTGLVLLLLWLGGLLLFTARIGPSAAKPVAADAVVVLTGGAGRIDAALKLLREQKARALLVSGVHSAVSAADLQRQYAIDPAIMQCCVTLGHRALDTWGNAYEARDWAEKQGYDRLIMVTADHHMTRALFIFRHGMPGYALQPYSVPTRPGLGARLIEYNKYLWTLIAVRGGLGGGGK